MRDGMYERPAGLPDRTAYLRTVENHYQGSILVGMFCLQADLTIDRHPFQKGYVWRARVLINTEDPDDAPMIYAYHGDKGSYETRDHAEHAALRFLDATY